MAEVLKINSHDELIAAIPHSLGFRPDSSMVCVGVGGGPTARVDLPDTHDEMGPWLKTLTDVYLRAGGPARVALVAFDDNRQRTVGALAALAQALSGGPEVGPVLWVRGEEWTEPVTGARGTVSASARARIDAEFAVLGRAMPAGSREELAAQMTGDPEPVAAHLPHTWERFRGLDESAVEVEVGWVAARVQSFLEDRRNLNDLDAARILVAVSDTGIRDATALAMGRTTAVVLSELWQDLTRRAPAEVRDAPSTLLGLSSWLEGNGAKAWTALDQLSEPNRLGEMVANALNRARHPDTWERAVSDVTGVALQRVVLRDHVIPGRGQPREPGIDPDLPGPAPGR